jgi:uncharacterized membrane protein YqaE (UPF0057 family)
MAVTCGDILKIVLAVLLPPLGVFAEKERCDKGDKPCLGLLSHDFCTKLGSGSPLTRLAVVADLLICILLTLLGYIPGDMVVQHCFSKRYLFLAGHLHAVRLVYSQFQSLMLLSVVCRNHLCKDTTSRTTFERLFLAVLAAADIRRDHCCFCVLCLPSSNRVQNMLCMLCRHSTSSSSTDGAPIICKDPCW